MRTRSIVSILAAAAVMTAGIVSAQDGSRPRALDQPKQKEQPKEKDKKEAAEVKLKVGDKAPSLTIDKWLKGEEVKGFEKGKVYVVEFWATWCPPCVASIPHLTELQKKHKDAVIIGVAGSERGSGNSVEQKLKTFIKDQGTKMEYRVAYESGGKMGQNWLRAAGQNGIPCAFIVDHEGKLAYIGHPMGMDGALDTAMKNVPKKS